MPPFRVEVSHSDADHPHSAPAHYGPAFDDAYAGLLQQALGQVDVDLLAEARKSAGRAVSEFPKKQGYTVRIVDLDADGNWVEVS